MELKLANHSSYPRIGDSAEGQVLRRTIAQREKGEKTGRDLRAAEDRMTELALQEQIQANLDLVTDGQIRWYDSVSHLAGKLNGARINGLLRFFDTNTYFRQPVVTGRLERTGPMVVDDFRFAREKSSRPVKVVLTGPYTLARLSVSEDGKAGGFEGMLEGYTRALAEEIAALDAAGVQTIQVDEPCWLKQPGDFAALERALGALGARKGSARLALAFYFGDAAPVYDKLQTLPVDELVLDFTYSPKLVETIASSGSAKALGLGLVDGRNTRLEDPGTVARQVERIFRAARLPAATLMPSCGLEYLPRDRAQLKLKHLSTLRKTLNGKGA
jgi:5-methyltetrahydropteroyltriglutamate--homocysteine methyltransferase